MTGTVRKGRLWKERLSCTVHAAARTLAAVNEFHDTARTVSFALSLSHHTWVLDTTHTRIRQ